MTTTSLARQERARLLDLFAQTGPDAPTLCEGWTTHDLAAHLVARERRPLAGPGLLVPALHGLTERYERAERERPYEDLLAALRRGAPWWSPVGSPVDRLYDVQNVHEFFVHLEDVRRPAGLPPRELPRALEDALWARLPLIGRLLAPGRGPLELVTPGARRLVLRRGPDPVLVRGEVGELFLWVHGRPAEVVVDGDLGV